MKKVANNLIFSFYVFFVSNSLSYARLFKNYIKKYIGKTQEIKKGTGGKGGN